METPKNAQARRGRYCHNCGREVPYRQVVGDVRCLRCGQHLKSCGNCFHFDGIDCMLRRPEAHEVYRGLNCPQFKFQRSVAAGSGVSPKRGKRTRLSESS